MALTTETVCWVILITHFLCIVIYILKDMTKALFQSEKPRPPTTYRESLPQGAGESIVFWQAYNEP